MYKEKLKHGHYYHIYNRGNNRESIFKEEKNYQYFLDLYRKYIHPISHLYAYCLMPTHFHLLVQIKELGDIDIMYNDEKSLWMQFRRFLGTYTKAINKMYERSGHLFAGRYSRIYISDNNHFFELISYIHLNPQSHGLVSHFKFWPFSSYYAYIKRDRRSMLARDIFSDHELYNTIMDMHELSILGRNIIWS
jgi:REP element-mobilizing transposase RayT